MPTRIDPARFTGKELIRAPALKESVNDFRIMIDGLQSGRIMERRPAGNVLKWFQILTASYHPSEIGANSGGEESLEQAQEALKARFWQWHAWALEQGGSY